MPNTVFKNGTVFDKDAVVAATVVKDDESVIEQWDVFIELADDLYACRIHIPFKTEQDAKAYSHELYTYVKARELTSGTSNE